MSVVADVVNEVTSRIAKVGFARRQAAGVFTMEIADGVLAWIGLNRASKRLGGDAVELNPVVGVRHQKVERVVAELRREKFHLFLPPTVSQPIGYVMPEHRVKVWRFEPTSIGEQAEELVSTIEAHAMPVLMPLVDLGAVLDAIEARWGFVHQLVYRRPVIQWMLGENGAAIKAIDDALAELGERSDAAAVELREFAKTLRAKVSSAD